MTTPARQHYLRTVAEREAAANAADSPMAGATGYELMMAKLAEDRRSLKQIQSTELKIEYKRKVLPEYADYVAGALAGGRGSQDDVLMTVLVWCLDCADYAAALPIATYGLQHGMTLPDRFERTLGTLVAEEAADTELRKHTAEKPMDCQALLGVLTIVEGVDMPDQVRAKLHKATGYALRQVGDYELAIDHLRRALTLHDKSGVKRDIELLEREVKKDEKPEGDTPQAAAGTTPPAP